MWLPAGSPPEFASKLGAAASAALAKPEVKEKLTAIGLIPVGSSAEGLTKETRRKHCAVAADREGDGIQDRELRSLVALHPVVMAGLDPAIHVRPRLP